MSKLPPMGPAAGLRVVAVENETLIALDLQDLLMAAGAREVLIARDIASLEDILKRDPPDIVIVNIEPARHGAAAAARLLQDAGIPFFIATGVNDPAILKGFSVPVVAKPYSANAILEALTQTMKGRSSRS